MIRKFALTMLPLARAIRSVPVKTTNYRFPVSKPTLYYLFYAVYFPKKKGKQIMQNQKPSLKMKTNKQLRMKRLVRN